MRAAQGQELHCKARRTWSADGEQNIQGAMLIVHGHLSAATLHLLCSLNERFCEEQALLCNTYAGTYCISVQSMLTGKHFCMHAGGD